MPGSRPAWEGEQGEAARVQLLRITAQTCAGEAVEVTLRSLPGQQKNCIRKSRITGNETERWLSAWRLQCLSSSSGLWSSPAADWSHFCILPTKKINLSSTKTSVFRVAFIFLSVRIWSCSCAYLSKYGSYARRVTSRTSQTVTCCVQTSWELLLLLGALAPRKPKHSKLKSPWSCAASAVVTAAQAVSFKKS